MNKPVKNVVATQWRWVLATMATVEVEVQVASVVLVAATGQHIIN